MTSDISKGEFVAVVYVFKTLAKAAKTRLEQCHLLHRDFRMTPAVLAGNDNRITKFRKGRSIGRNEWDNLQDDENDCNSCELFENVIAIPVILPFHDGHHDGPAIYFTDPHDKHPNNSEHPQEDPIDENDIQRSNHRTLSPLWTHIHDVFLNMSGSNLRVRDAVTEVDGLDVLLGYGFQYCPYSSFALGNRHFPRPKALLHQQMRHLPCPISGTDITDAIIFQGSQAAFTVIRPEKSGLNRIQRALLQAMESYRQKYNSSTEIDGSAFKNSENPTASDSSPITAKITSWILGLDTHSCPCKLQVLGNDRTLVLPARAFVFECGEETNHGNRDDETTKNIEHHSPIRNHEPSLYQHPNELRTILQNLQLNISQEHQNPSFQVSSAVREYEVEQDFCLNHLWPALAASHGSARVVRRGEISPESPTRTSNYHLLWPFHGDPDTTGPGSPGWITVTEQGIDYSFDLTRVMFSRGNVTEKIRFGQELVEPGDVLVDLYGGIGYFTLPALVHGKARHVYVCEWNPVAVQYLKFNLEANGVSDRATVFEGDCRDVAVTHRLVDVADRVSLGLIPSSEGGWKTAVNCLRRQTGGWLHVHGNVPATEVKQWAQWVCRSLHEIRQQQHEVCADSMRTTVAVVEELPGNENIQQKTWITVCTHVERVKSFAPNVYHYVADIYMGPRIMPFSARNDQPPAAAAMNATSRKRRVLASMPLSMEVAILVTPGRGEGKATSPLQSSGATDIECEFVSCSQVISPPSCALSMGGKLFHEWMR